MKWFAEFTGNPRNKFMGFADGKHGTEIFPVHPELPKAIVAWFTDTLIKAPADAKKPIQFKHSPSADFWAALESPGGTAKAAELYRQARKSDPKAFLFPEAVLTSLLMDACRPAR